MVCGGEGFASRRLVALRLSLVRGPVQGGLFRSRGPEKQLFRTDEDFGKPVKVDRVENEANDKPDVSKHAQILFNFDDIFEKTIRLHEMTETDSHSNRQVPEKLDNRRPKIA